MLKVSKNSIRGPDQREVFVVPAHLWLSWLLTALTSAEALGALSDWGQLIFHIFRDFLLPMNAESAPQ